MRCLPVMPFSSSIFFFYTRTHRNLIQEWRIHSTDYEKIIIFALQIFIWRFLANINGCEIFFLDSIVFIYAILSKKTEIADMKTSHSYFHYFAVFITTDNFTQKSTWIL